MLESATTMPVTLARRGPHDVIYLKRLGLIAPGADEPTHSDDLQQLPVLVVMPVGAGSGGEAHVVHSDTVRR